MELTVKEQAARRRAWRRDKIVWYYVSDRMLDVYNFSAEMHIPMPRLLHALQVAGILRQWDQKREIMR